MVSAVGPAFVGGFEKFVVQGDDRQYTILYLPDRNNELLQAEGKPPSFYWVPGEVRIAQKGDGGDFKFHHTHFVGVLSEDTHIGVEDGAEVQGGILGFTTTARYPTSVLAAAEQQLLAKFRGDDDRYWGWRTGAAPQFRIAPIQSNHTAVTSLSPGSNGLSALEQTAIQNGEDLSHTGGSGGGNGGPPAPRFSHTHSSGRIAHGRDFQRRSNLDPWAFQMQGQGAGSVTGGENAYSAMMGAYPSEILWAGFHGSYSPMVVAQNLVLPMWSQEIYLRIHGSWERIFEHFSAHVNARKLWFSADIKVELNKLITSGDIEVELAIDGTVPGSERIQGEIDKRIDLIVDKFMAQANEMIFQPPTPEVEPARAPSGGFLSRIFGGGGVALNYNRERRSLNLSYEETRHHRYLQPTTISSNMGGIFEEMKQDPDAEKKYFSRLILGDLGRKVYRVVKPVVRWREPGNEYIGDPVAFCSAQIGYPDGEGELIWRPSLFERGGSDQDSKDVVEFARRNADEVNNAPDDWTPDQTFIKRTIHFDESMGATDDPYVKVYVEKNTIEIDEGPNGSLGNDSTIEVRADSVGKLELEIGGLDIMLQDASQVVSVEVQPDGRRDDGSTREAVSFLFKHDDQDRSRILEIFTGQSDYVPSYSYRVHVVVKGTLMSRGMAWTGPWRRGNTNGSIMVHVPLADDEGVTNVSRFSAREVLDRFGAAMHDMHDQDTGVVSSVPPSYAGHASDSLPGTNAGTSPPPGRRTIGEHEDSSVQGYRIGPPPETA